MAPGAVTLRHGDRPVRGPILGAERSEPDMKNILVAYDGGEPAHRALETAIELTKRFGARLAVVSVVPVHPGRAPIDPWDDKVEHDRQLAEARELLAASGVVAEMLEPAGKPAEAIERVAEMGKFDTVVVGSRGLGAVGRFLQGSVSEHVATHANATVIVAR
jgi:nucleotide-binding universal stress UspA family protein